MSDNDDYIQPYRMQLNFTGAHEDESVLTDILEAVVEEAEKRGIFFEHAFFGKMLLNDVIPGSPLDQVVHGYEPEDGEVDFPDGLPQPRA
jgi:hypothetical protein